MRLVGCVLLALRCTAVCGGKAEPFEWNGAQGTVCPREVCSEAGCALGGWAVKAALLAEGTLVAKDIEEKMELLAARSVVTIAVQGGSTVLEAARGRSDAANSKATGNTKYQIASVTKVFTSIMLFQLRDRGALPQGLDSRVGDLIPELGIKGPSLRALAMHASGLPRDLDCGEVPPSTCSPAEAIKAVKDATLLGVAFSRIAYSNLGIALLGRALERAAGGQSWESWVANEILRPLDMQDSGVVTAEALANGLVLADGADPVTGEVLSPTVEGWTSPAGGMYSSARDMAKLMNFLLGSLTAKTAEKVLARESVLELLSTGIASRDGTSGVAAGTLESFPFRGRAAVGKMGCLPGVRTDMILIPSLKLGVFVVAGSTCDSRGDGDAIAHPLAWRLASRVELLLDQAAASAFSAPVLASTFEGHYSCGDNFTSQVVVRELPFRRMLLINGPNGDPRVKRGMPYVLLPAKGDLFRLSLGDGALAKHLPHDWPGCSSPKWNEYFGLVSQNLCPISCTLRMLRGDGQFLRFFRSGLVRQVSGFELLGSGQTRCLKLSHSQAASQSLQ